MKKYNTVTINQPMVRTNFFDSILAWLWPELAMKRLIARARLHELLKEEFDRERRPKQPNPWTRLEEFRYFNK